MSRARTAILIVDDEPVALRAIRMELMDRYGGQHLLETAQGAPEALAIIAELCAEGVRVILIISDWLMPDIKGDEFLAAVKAEHPEVRCIIISGQADPEAIERARRLVELDAFLAKPWRHADLMAAVDACIARVEADGAGPPGRGAT